MPITTGDTIFTLLSYMNHDLYPEPSDPVDTFDYASEYELIKQKKSELSRGDRDRVVRKIEGKSCLKTK